MGRLPLEGIRVIDFGWVWAGPVLGQHLADFGAEVIKIESRKRIDLARSTPSISPDLEPGPEVCSMFHNFNRNKLSLTVDLSHPEGVKLVRQLVRVSDIAVENFSPRVLAKFGLAYDDLRLVKPDIIMATLYAAGSYGPLKDIVTYGPSLSALAGLDGLVGYADGRVLGMQTAYADPTAGTIGVFAVLAALLHRELTGEGQYIDMSQWEATSALLGEAIMDYTMNGTVHGPSGNRHRHMVPHGCYPCDGKDAWITVAVDSEVEWRSLCQVMGDPEWSKDERFADGYRRLNNREELDARIADWTRGFSKMSLQERLQAEGVAAMAVFNVEDRYCNPHWQSREVHVPLPHPFVPDDAVYGIGWKLSETPGSLRRHAPLLGEHNEYILCDLLGMDKNTLDRLTEEKVLY
ncbi:MAG: CoA transferase [Dehalococcoidia bacterium]|nr:CoA transferase [Dehalococcoidia bacterium]